MACLVRRCAPQIGRPVMKRGTRRQTRRITILSTYAAAKVVTSTIAVVPDWPTTKATPSG